MFRAVGSVLKRNKESIYGIARGSTSSSHRAFTCNVTSSTTVNSASSSPLAGNSFNGLRSLLKGQKAPTFRKMSTFRKILHTILKILNINLLNGMSHVLIHSLLSDEAWAKEFEKYKQSPEYKRVNKGMNLEDFKFIYWMEYAHRMWGRGLGIMFALPFSYFLRKGYITLRLGVQLSGLFALGAGQGFIGWWMVKSGLEEPPSEYSQPRVSPYRLAAHLTSAFAIYCGLFWTALSVVMPEPPAESLAWVRGAAKVKKLALPVSFIVGITAISGAFVAGNDAGRAFNTFPKMGDTWIPDGIFEMKPLIRNFFENTATVQLDHRLLATTTLLAIGTMWWFTRKLDIHPAVKALIGSTVGMTAVQVTLGVSTLLSYVPVSLGSAHQAGALTLLTLMLLLNHTLRRPSPSLLKSLPPVVKSNFS
ncbi:PREDICTED: cytochrome c oxidase assembly protein COX15-like [Brassica oleracea var. oleracea]|uniref:cytochrome c oxidase assembly protein COX15-like n=1 Tax=Brassica oleracea var. oleracea TaxID=109376 RepID=UPI0006A736B8|nr:PREDICTED: cytochrome c oxidase assembly protein COX15-like [Brassica oleracea var. oleracea]